MRSAFYQIALMVQPKGGGEAGLFSPKVLQDKNYHFMLV